MNRLTLGSLFDGSGGFPLGGLLHGITPIWAAEIEPYPIAVTRTWLPQMRHIGDVSKINGAEIEPVDIISFGSPCTNLSLAGRREGLNGKQSVLFYEAVRIIKEMRCSTHGRYPRYALWENVPGAFSSNKGADFKAVIDAIIQIREPGAEVPSPEKDGWPHADVYMGDGWSLAYRTLNAQYFGVAQRRRRIYLVADFASDRAGEILFEPEGVSRDYSPVGSPWKEAARDPENCADEAVICLNDQGGERMDVTNGHAGTLRAEAHHPPCVIGAAGFCTEHSAKSRGIGYEKERSPTLRAGVVPGVSIESHPQDSRIKIRDDGTVQTLAAQMGKGGGNVPLTLDIKPESGNGQTAFVPKAYGICSKDSNAMKSINPDSGIYEAGTARTIDAKGGNPSCNQGGIAIVDAIPFTQNQRDEVRTLGNKAGALCASGTKQQTYVLQGSMIGREDKNGPQGSGIDEDLSFTLNTVDRHAVAYSMTTGSYGITNEEKVSTLMARDYKDAPLVGQPYQDVTGTIAAGAHPGGFNGQDAYSDMLIPMSNGVEYVVRRLTPIECARLQGFPSDWGTIQIKDDLNDDEYSFWLEVRNTHDIITGGRAKNYSRKQMLRWYNKLHSDAAEYKMWGNGVALPCVSFVMKGLLDSSKES